MNLFKIFNRFLEYFNNRILEITSKINSQKTNKIFKIKATRIGLLIKAMNKWTTFTT